MIRPAAGPAVRADLADDDDVDAILELNRQTYGPTDELVAPADFDWRMAQNPAGRAVVPVVRDEGGRVVGFVWIEPVRLRVRGHNVRSAAVTNLVIEPRHRDGLAYVKLMRRLEAALHESGVPLHYSFISDRAYELERASGRAWNVPILARPSLPPIGMPRRRGGRGGIAVNAAEAFDASFDQLWAQARDRYPLMLVRDRDFLAWRFAPVSRRRYRTLAAHVDGRLAGYAVARVTRIRRVRTGLVLDLLLGPDSSLEVGAALLAEAQAYFRAQRAVVATAMMAAGTLEYEALRRAGYLRLPEAVSPRSFHFAHYVHDVPGNPVSDPIGERDWFVTFADYESY